MMHNHRALKTALRGSVLPKPYVESAGLQRVVQLHRGQIISRLCSGRGGALLTVLAGGTAVRVELNARS